MLLFATGHTWTCFPAALGLPMAGGPQKKWVWSIVPACKEISLATTCSASAAAEELVGRRVCDDVRWTLCQEHSHPLPFLPFIYHWTSRSCIAQFPVLALLQHIISLMPTLIGLAFKFHVLFLLGSRSATFTLAVAEAELSVSSLYVRYAFFVNLCCHHSLWCSHWEDGGKVVFTHLYILHCNVLATGMLLVRSA